MHQSSQQLVTLALATVSTLIILPSQAQNLEELTNENPNNTISSELLRAVDNVGSSPISDASTVSNSKADLSSVEANNSTATPNVPTSTPNVRLPINSRIFVVPSMQQ